MLQENVSGYVLKFISICLMKLGTKKCILRAIKFVMIGADGGGGTNYLGQTVLHVVVFLSDIFICKFYTLTFQAGPN